MNFDPFELRKFDASADRWWDANSDFGPLHQINPLRLEWMAKHATLAGRRVVDIGCGGGILSEAMAAMGADVTGIDLAQKALDAAEQHAHASKVSVRYLNIAAEHLAAKEPASYDIVTCMEMLEHVPDPQAIVRACADLTIPGGRVFFSTLNRNLKSFLFAIIGAEYLLRMLPAGTHSHKKFITPSELSSLARNAGLTVEAMAGIGYNPFSRRFSLSDDTGVNYLIACAKPA